jgi:Tol biopolymer transport system component
MVPDGTKIAFARFQPEASTGSIEIVAGTGFRSIFECACPVVAGPRWSPDGATIAFSTEGTHAIHLVPAAGGMVHDVSTCSGRLCATPYRLAWSPDGKSIAFTSSHDQLFVASETGGGVRPIASDVLCCSTWLPN